MRLKLASGTLNGTENTWRWRNWRPGPCRPRPEHRRPRLRQAARWARAPKPRATSGRDLALKQDAEVRAGIDARAADAAKARDGNALVQVGQVYVSMGQADKGVALIEQGIAKGGLRRPEDAKLRLGQAQLQAAQAKSKAAATLRSVQGSDGAADIARLWILLA